MLKNSKAFTTFSTKDIKITEKFYKDTLGLNVSENKMGLLELELTNCSVLIYPKQDHKPANFTVLNFYVQDIQKEVSSLTKKGVQFEKYDGEIKTDSFGIHKGELGPAIAWFKDPSGNILSLIQEEK
ncbi:VOC family protein [Christiangramia sediminis]|uniref:VOC family protein n=1 Tax=Christiangramia sediminis TaxID=2881336 RepID=A0A9X1LGV3_9FLAO|nr:VOC family protein [Christiangramia sediminis]MCB7480133.1 VOC family protein [Christiangramia sediminis]